MKFCKDCEYFSGSNFCHAPQNGVSPVDGSFKPKFASVAREEELGCGHKAHYFVEKKVPPKRWWKIWS